MASRLVLTRELADIERFKLRSEDLIFCDFPDVFLELKVAGYNPISSAGLTDRSFWEQVIQLRNQLMSAIDFSQLNTMGLVETELLDSFRFSIHLYLSAYTYEFLIIEKIHKKFTFNEIVFGNHFSQSLFDNRNLKRNNIAQIIQFLNEIKYKHFIVPIRQALFEASMLSLRLNSNRSVLAFSTGSGLEQALKNGFLENWKYKTTFLINDHLKRQSITGIFHWLTRLFVNRQMFPGISLPAPKALPVNDKIGKVVDKKSIKNALKANAIDKVLGCTINQLSSNLALAITENLSNCLSKCQRDKLVAKRVFGSIKPKLFIAQHSLYLPSSLALEARALGIKSLLITHGSHIYTDDSLLLAEWKNHSKTMLTGPFDATAIQTPAMDLFYDKLEAKPTKLVTGPIIVRGSELKSNQKMRQKLFGRNADKLILLHAGTPKSANSLRPLIYETLDEYVANISALVKAASKYSELHIAIRFRSVPGLSASSIKREISDYKNWSWCEFGKFEDWLASSDVLVSYSSTTIEQAFLSSKPVLLFDKKKHHQYFSAGAVGLPKEELKGICYCNEENFWSELEKLMCKDTQQDMPSINSIYSSFEKGTLSSCNEVDDFLSRIQND